MNSTATIIKIGNSNGIIIPSRLLKLLEIREKDNVTITEVGGGIYLRKVEETEVKTPFSSLDRWYAEHGYQDESPVDSLAYVESLRKSRKNKEIKEW